MEELRYELPAETLEARWEMPGTESVGLNMSKEERLFELIIIHYNYNSL